MSKYYYHLLSAVGMLGGLGSAFVGVEHALVGFKNGNVLNAFPATFIALLCVALYLYSMRKLAAFDAPQLVDEAVTTQFKKQASWDNPTPRDY